MSKIGTLINLLRSNRKLISVALTNNIRQWRLSHLIPDTLMLRWVYRAYIGRRLDLKDPIGWNAKLQWLKLHDRKPEYTMMVDKLAVKDYIASTIGEQYIIPTLGSWSSADEIDFDTLPQKFVIKCNHDSHSVIVCKDKNKLDFDKTRKKLDKCLSNNMYWWGREWPYKNVKPKILAEKFLEDKESPDDLKDYKLMCFNGDVKCSFVCSERYSGDGLKVTFFDHNWHKLPFERHFPASQRDIPKPENYDLMISLAKKISSNIPFVRVDFYEVNGQVYFGELTFYPGAGFEEITPFEWDVKLGNWIDIKSI